MATVGSVHVRAEVVFPGWFARGGDLVVVVEADVAGGEDVSGAELVVVEARKAGKDSPFVVRNFLKTCTEDEHQALVDAVNAQCERMKEAA